MPTILAQIMGPELLGPLPWIIALLSFGYLFYKTVLSEFIGGKETEAKEWRRMLVGFPAAVLVLFMILLSVLTVSLEAIFGPAVDIVNFLLKIFIPIGLGIGFAIVPAFVTMLFKKEMKYPGV